MRKVNSKSKKNRKKFICCPTDAIEIIDSDEIPFVNRDGLDESLDELLGLFGNYN